MADDSPSPGEVSEFRRSRRTRFLADENMEPWAVWLMKRNNLDVITATDAGIRHHDDRAIFAAAWTHARLLVTHDRGFLDDRRFPVNRCSGLLVLPDMGRQTMAFGRLVISATERVHKGSDLWFGTKIVASREGVLTVRTWERSEGNIQTWRHVVRTLSD